MPRDDERESGPPIESEAQEKLGIEWLRDLHKKMEAIRAHRLRLVRESEDLTEDEAMDIVLTCEASLRVLITTEIKPVAENRGEWGNLSLSIEGELTEDGSDILNPDDPDFFSLYGQYIDIVLGEVEKAMELYGLKVTPLPMQTDILGIAWESTLEEARHKAEEEIGWKRKKISEARVKKIDSEEVKPDA